MACRALKVGESGVDQSAAVRIDAHIICNEHVLKGRKHAMTWPHAARSKIHAPRSPVFEALGAAWVIFKFALSLGLVYVAALLLWTSKDLLNHPGPLGVAAFLLFLATLPWVVAKRTSRGVGLLSVFMSIMFAFLAGNLVTGGVQFPQVCKGRSAGLCELFNGLHALGGPWLAASPTLVIAAALLGGGILILVRGDRSVRPWQW